jgi:TDG/mug DNA glycosylase family protein
MSDEPSQDTEAVAAPPAGWVLPDLLRPGLRLVFVGFAASEESARRGPYYAKGGNAVWRLLHVAGLTPVQLQPEEDARLLDYGIGATDLVKDAWGRDPAVIGQLRAREPDLDAALRARALDLHARLLAAAPQVICFNGTHTITGTVLRKGALALLTEVSRSTPTPVENGHLGPSLLHTVTSTSGAAAYYYRQREDEFRTLNTLLDPLPDPPAG